MLVPLEELEAGPESWTWSGAELFELIEWWCVHGIDLEGFRAKVQAMRGVFSVLEPPQIAGASLVVMLEAAFIRVPVALMMSIRQPDRRPLAVTRFICFAKELGYVV